MWQHGNVAGGYIVLAGTAGTQLQLYEDENILLHKDFDKIVNTQQGDFNFLKFLDPGIVTVFL